MLVLFCTHFMHIYMLFVSLPTDLATQWCVGCLLCWMYKSGNWLVNL